MIIGSIDPSSGPAPCHLQRGLPATVRRQAQPPAATATTHVPADAGEPLVEAQLPHARGVRCEDTRDLRPGFAQVLAMGRTQRGRLLLMLIAAENVKRDSRPRAVAWSIQPCLQRSGYIRKAIKCLA
jgi:hypothetical protein